MGVSNPQNNVETRDQTFPKLKTIRHRHSSSKYQSLGKAMYHSIAMATLCCLMLAYNRQYRSVLGFSFDHHTAQSVHTIIKSYQQKRTTSSISQSHNLFSNLASNSAQKTMSINQIIYTTCLHMTRNSPDEESNPKNSNGKKPKKKKIAVNTTDSATSRTPSNELEILKRISQLEQLVAKQEVEISHLRKECKDLTAAAEAFARIVELLRDAGLDAENIDPAKSAQEKPNTYKKESKEDLEATNTLSSPKEMMGPEGENRFEYFDDSEIFGTAPSSVTDAADAAGAAILAALLAGKQRMLVDVRDAELSRDPETLVQFIELAVLPVAAGLEGLKSARNRVKIVFPTVSQLLMYRRTMALAAPEVVSLSTLGFDPVEKHDNLVVIVAPAPDDEEGLNAMNDLLSPSDTSSKPVLRQPTVVLNHHMVPLSGPAAQYVVAYHLRLLSVQYMTGDNAPEYYEKWEERLKEKAKKKLDEGHPANKNPPLDILYGPSTDNTEDAPSEDVVLEDEVQSEKGNMPEEDNVVQEEDAALEAAVQHAHELGVFNQGVTRAMVIRAYPKPWNVFVDTSPDTDADFEVAATFDEEPNQDDVNFAIVECLEGSEREDELVAQQMQQALEAGQLDRVSEMLGLSPDFAVDDDNLTQSLLEKDEDDDWYSDFEGFEEDSC
mmetsp:Transcript_18740/g.26432  ORF Transcript_18740/g.26432 Transcript_18740/m.26432 type:complete len:665 (-) Transcript_18740:1122-3116(-)